MNTLKKRSEKREPSWWQPALRHLSKVDAVQKKLIELFPHSYLPDKKTDPFVTLVNSIVGQQISSQAAQAIKQRLIAGNLFSLSSISQTAEETLQTAGLSRQKSKYLKGIADWFIERKINEHWFSHESNENIVKELLLIKGVGPWTVQMFQIFYLLEPDILPQTDVGLIKAMMRAYRLDRQDASNGLIQIAESLWSPYSTAAVWFLWRSLDTEEVNY